LLFIYNVKQTLRKCNHLYLQHRSKTGTFSQNVLPQLTGEVFVGQSVAVGLRVLQDVKVKGCSRASQTHNTLIKVVNEFTEDTKTGHLKTGKSSQQNTCLLVMKVADGRTRNYWWPHVAIAGLYYPAQSKKLFSSFSLSGLFSASNNVSREVSRTVINITVFCISWSSI
jgi:hypothetical protein